MGKPNIFHTGRTICEHIHVRGCWEHIDGPGLWVPREKTWMGQAPSSSAHSLSFNNNIGVSQAIWLPQIILKPHVLDNQRLIFRVPQFEIHSYDRSCSSLVIIPHCRKRSPSHIRRKVVTSRMQSGHVAGFVIGFVDWKSPGNLTVSNHYGWVSDRSFPVKKTLSRSAKKHET